MTMNFTYSLLAVSTFVFLSFIATSQGINWECGEDCQLRMAPRCDFYGNDLYQVDDSAEECGELCLEESRCTHFTHAYNKCYLKRFEHPPTATDCSNCFVCGWVDHRQRK